MRRRGTAAPSAPRRIEQRLERVGVSLGLQQQLPSSAPALAHRAVDRGDERPRVRIRRARPGRSARVKKALKLSNCSGIGLRASLMSGWKLPTKRSIRTFLTSGTRAARHRVHHARQRVLRQQVLQGDEGARREAVRIGAGVRQPAAPVRYGAARLRSRASAATSNGGVKMATMARVASSRKTTAE